MDFLIIGMFVGLMLFFTFQVAKNPGTYSSRRRSRRSHSQEKDFSGYSGFYGGSAHTGFGSGDCNGGDFSGGPGCDY